MKKENNLNDKNLSELKFKLQQLMIKIFSLNEDLDLLQGDKYSGNDTEQDMTRKLRECWVEQEQLENLIEKEELNKVSDNDNSPQQKSHNTGIIPPLVSKESIFNKEKNTQEQNGDNSTNLSM